MAFKKAVKSESKLRLAMTGPAGTGKTYTALTIARELAAGREVAVIDTERGSAAKYADVFDFDVMELSAPYHPDRYIAAIREAEAGGYAVLIIDSLTHAWDGPGGVLELHEQAVKKQKTPNSYTAWADVTPLHNRLIDAMLNANLHVIVTMRAKTEYVQDKSSSGGTVIRKVGMEAIQRKGMEFEFDFIGELNQEHDIVFTKVRNCPELDGAVISKPGKQLAQILRTWLAGEPAQTTTPPAETSQPATDTTAPEPLTWGALRQKALKIAPTQGDWESLIKRATGKQSGLTDDDKPAVVAEIEKLKAELKEADLRKLQPAGRH